MLFGVVLLKINFFMNQCIQTHYSLQMETKVKPNVFLALHITSDAVKENLEKVQQDYIGKDERLKEFLVPIAGAHITLVVFHVEEERLVESKKILRKVFEDKLEGKHFQSIVFKGLGKFGSKVVYAKPVEGQNVLTSIREVFSQQLLDHGFEVCGDGFNPHLTILKGKRQRGRRAKKCKQKIIQENFCLNDDLFFGAQDVSSIHYLSMYKEKDELGGYFCEDTFNI